MSREIKFRVWNKTIKRMCDWDDIKTGADFNDLEDDNGEWMQYTGLRDKNGKEIYEGDIVTGWFDHEKITGYIFYGSDAKFYIERNGLFGIELNNAQDWTEVIGNIYENPELLEGEHETD